MRSAVQLFSVYTEALTGLKKACKVYGVKKAVHRCSKLVRINDITGTGLSSVCAIGRMPAWQSTMLEQ